MLIDLITDYHVIVEEYVPHKQIVGLWAEIAWERDVNPPNHSLTTAHTQMTITRTPTLSFMNEPFSLICYIYGNITVDLLSAINDLITYMLVQAIKLIINVK